MWRQVARFRQASTQAWVGRLGLPLTPDIQLTSDQPPGLAILHYVFDGEQGTSIHESEHSLFEAVMRDDSNSD
jgi:hypothetical protein